LPSSLQWGHVLKDAEIQSSCRMYRRPGPLQWGRVLKDAEIASIIVYDNVRAMASMGPRLEGRGNPAPERRMETG